MDPDDAVEVWDEVCAPMALVARALPGDKVNLVRLLGIVGYGKGSLDGFLAVALKAAIEKPFSSEIAAFVRSRKALAELDLAPAAVSDPQLDDDEEDEAVVSSGEADADDADTDETEADDDVDEDDDAEDDVVEGGHPPQNATDDFFETFRSLLETIYDAEAAADVSLANQVAAARQRAISAFDPLRARIPSLEEARRQSQPTAVGGAGRERALRPQSGAATGAKAKSGPNPLLASGGSMSSGGGGKSSPAKAAARRGQAPVGQPWETETNRRLRE